jgi:hypothetical protein
MAIEIYIQPLQSKPNSETLRLSTKSFFLPSRRNSMAEKHPLRRIKVWRDMVRQNFLNYLLARFLMMRRDLLKRLIDWCKNGEVRGCAIEQLHQVVVVIDKLGELGGVLAAGDELVDCLVWLSMVRMVWAMRRMMRMVWGMWRMMRMIPNSGFVGFFGDVVGGIQPALRVKCFK